MGALLEARNGEKALTPLHIAAELAKEDVVKVLISAGASIYATSNSGATAFYRAARGGSVKILELLYKAGGDINVQTWDHWTPVFEAIEMGKEGILDKLLSWGAELQLLNNFKRTPLSTAIMFERPRMVVKIANKLQQIARDRESNGFYGRSRITHSYRRLRFELHPTSMLSVPYVLFLCYTGCSLRSLPPLLL